MKNNRTVKAEMRCLLATLLCSAGASLASAQTKQGDSILALNLGLGLPVSSLNPPGLGITSQNPGSSGLVIGGQCFYHVSDHVGLGGEIEYDDFADRDFAPPRFGETISGSLLTISALARYLFLPENKITPYLIGGLGINQFSANIHETRDPSDVLLDANSTGMGLSAGGGVEGYLSRNLIAGAEMRWRLSLIDSSKFGTDWLNSLNFLARLGWKF